MKFIRQHVAVKSVLGIVLLLIVFFAFVSVIGYDAFTKALLDQYADGAFRVAETALLYIDSTRMKEYEASGGATEEYAEAYDSLQEVCDSTGSTFIYVIIPDTTDYAHIKFIFSTMNSKSSYTHYPFGYLRETTNDEYREKYRILYEGGADRELVVRDKGFIETDPHITAMIPLHDASGNTDALLCVQRQMDVLKNARNSYLRRIGIVLAVISLVFIVLHVFYLKRVFLDPVKKIMAEASRFAEENVPAEQKLCDTIPNRDEIGLLAASIDRMEEQVKEYEDDLTAATAEKERIGAELALAARLQAAYLPDKFPAFPDRTEFDVYASMDPAKEVGGDFYDFYLTDDDHLCIVMADVSGKGVPAALFMMVSKLILQSCSMRGKSAAEVLEMANNAICSNNKENMFVTVWLGLLELSTGRLIAANAGHEYPALMRSGGSFELVHDKHGLVMGAMNGVSYRQYELQLNRGDKLFLYTDGVPEASDGSGTMFGTERMVASLNSEPGAPPEAILKNVRGALDGFVNDAEQFDDITMLCLEYRGGQ